MAFCITGYCCYSLNNIRQHVQSNLHNISCVEPRLHCLTCIYHRYFRLRSLKYLCIYRVAIYICNSCSTVTSVHGICSPSVNVFQRASPREYINTRAASAMYWCNHATSDLYPSCTNFWVVVKLQLAVLLPRDWSDWSRLMKWQAASTTNLRAWAYVNCDPDGGTLTQVSCTPWYTSRRVVPVVH